MIPEMRPDTASPTNTAATDERLPTAQDEPPPTPSLSPPPPDTTADTSAPASRREASPPTTPPPMSPRGSLATSVQRMPLGWRWALGLLLAFLSGFGVMWLWIIPPAVAFVPVALLMIAALALAAGYVLNAWWATLLLAVALEAGGAVGSAIFVFLSPAGASKGPPGMSSFALALYIYALLFTPFTIVILFFGNAISRARGVPIVRLGGAERALDGVPGHRWIPSLGLTLVGGFFAGLDAPFVIGLVANPPFLPFTLLPTLFAVTCAIAGWLLRSRWGLVAVPALYVVAAAVVSLLTVNQEPYRGVADWAAAAGWFALWVILPAVLMCAIGTTIGMYASSVKAQRPHSGQASPA